MFRQKQIKNLVAADLTALTAITMDGKEVVYVESENEFYTKVAGVNTMIEASQSVATIALLQNYTGSRTQLQVLDAQGAGMWFSYVTTGTHDGGIYFTATGKGSGFWKRENLSDFIIPEWFNAKGDGTTNDHTAFKAIRDSLSTGLFSKLTFSKNKTYLVDPPVTAGILTNTESFYIGDGVTIDGNGSTLKLGTTDTVLQYLIVQGSNITIKNINLIGNDTTATSEFSAGIALFPIATGKKNVLIENVVISKFRGDGIYVGPNDVIKTMYYKDIVIRNVQATECYRNGISLVSAENVIIDNFSDSQTGFWGIDLEPDDATEVLNNVIIKNSYISNLATTSVTTIPPIKNIVIQNVSFDNARRTDAYPQNTLSNLFITNAENVLIDGIYVRNTKSYGNVLVHDILRFEKVKNANVNNVKIVETQNPAIGSLMFRGQGSADVTQFNLSNIDISTEAGFGLSNILVFSSGSIWNVDNLKVDSCLNFAYQTKVNLFNSSVVCRGSILDQPVGDVYVENSTLSGTFLTANATASGFIVDVKKSNITLSNLLVFSGNLPMFFADLESNINGHKKQAISNTTIAAFDRTFGYSQYSVENTAATGFTVMNFEKSKGRKITFSDGNGTMSTNFLNLFFQSGTINGQASPYRLDKNNGVWEVYSDGTNWQVREVSGIVSQNQQIQTAGLTVTLAQSTTDLLVNPATDLASETITLKTTPRIGDTVRVRFGGTITAGNNVITGATTFAGGTTYGDTIPSNIKGGDEIHLYFDGTNWKVKYIPFSNSAGGIYETAIEGTFTAIADVTVTTAYTINVSPNVPVGTNVSRYELYHNGIRLKRGVRWNYTSNNGSQVTLDVLATPAFPVMTGDVLDIVIK